MASDQRKSNKSAKRTKPKGREGSTSDYGTHAHAHTQRGEYTVEYIVSTNGGESAVARCALRAVAIEIDGKVKSDFVQSAHTHPHRHTLVAVFLSLSRCASTIRLRQTRWRIASSVSPPPSPSSLNLNLDLGLSRIQGRPTRPRARSKAKPRPKVAKEKMHRHQS